MKLSSQTLPELDDVTEADIERIIGGEAFGKFALLGDCDGDFIQVGHKGQPAPWAFDYPPGSSEAPNRRGMEGLQGTDGFRVVDDRLFRRRQRRAVRGRRRPDVGRGETGVRRIPARG